MNRLISHNLWPTISKLAKKSVKRAAVAYVSSDDYIQFRDGDLLVCDASTKAIKSGQTSAVVLKKAYDRKAKLYNLPGLHSKIILLNELALIGSANASESSASNLIEAGLLTDQPTIVTAAQSFVNQMASQAKELNDRQLEKLLAIKVERNGQRAGKARARFRATARGYRTWIIGTTELVKDGPEDQEVIEQAVESSQEKLSNPRSTVEWVRWTGSSRFRKSCRKDDWLIQIWRPEGRKTPTWVYPPLPVLDRLDFDGATYFLYEEFPTADSNAKRWGEFKKLAQRAGINRKLRSGSEIEITENQSDSLAALWKEA